MNSAVAIFLGQVVSVMGGGRPASMHIHMDVRIRASSQKPNDDDDAETQSAVMYCCADMFKYA